MFGESGVSVKKAEGKKVRMLVGKTGVSSPRRIQLVIDLGKLDMHEIMTGIRNGLFCSISVYQSDLQIVESWQA